MRRCAVLLAAPACALAFAASASAHGTIRPNLVPPGSTRDFTILIPNSRADAQIVGLDVTVPKGGRLIDAAAGGGWQATTRGRTVTWRGGAIPPNGFDSFGLRARMPAKTGTVTFMGREIYGHVTEPSFPLQVVLVASASTEGATSDDGAARTLALAALIVAIVAAALAAGAFVLALAQWLRR